MYNVKTHQCQRLYIIHFQMNKDGISEDK